MRVLIAAPWFRTIAESHHAALAGMGHDVRTITTDAQSGRVVSSISGVTVLDPHMRGNSINRNTMSLLKSVRDWKPDVAILDATWDIRFVMLAKCAGMVLTAIHDPTPHDKAHVRKGWKAYAESYSRRISSHNLFYSEFSRTAAGSETPASVLALPSELKNDSIPNSSTSSRVGAAFVGRLSEYKGFDVLLDAWAKLDPALRKENSLQVLCSGSPAPSIPFDDVRVKSGTYTDADAIQTIRSARVLVLPYREASQSSVQVLAQQLGTPCVVTDVGALPEMQPNGHPVVPAGDSAALTAAVACVLRTDRWRQLSDEAVAAFEKHHSETAVVAGLSNALGSL